VRTRSLGMLRVCLGDSSMRLGVPFIAPRQLGAVGDNLGRLILPSVGAPDSPLRHQTVTVDGLVRICFLFWRRQPLQIRGSWRTEHCPVHTRQSGAPCRLLAWATRRSRIARPTVAQPTVGSPDSPMHYRTVR
jgi:hypothetical protein